ncbi:MAG: alpha-glucosidase [Lachnospiraceae bacterium]|nr:alpha-glucosidase [Lachnospiraceae bacterium]
MFYETIQLCVGAGQNNFSMKRGSFKYKQSFLWKEKCVLKEKTGTCDETDFIYQSKKAGETLHLKVTKKGDRTEVRLTSEAGSHSKINRFWLTFETDPQEHIYGCGETYSEFDLKGQKVRIWVAEHQNVARISAKIIKEKLRGPRPKKKLAFDQYESYYVQPTFTSSDKYFVHVDMRTYGEFDFTANDKITIYAQEFPTIISERAESFTELSGKLTALLGRQKKLPDWIYRGGILAMQDWVKAEDKVIEGFDGCGNIDRKLSELEKHHAKVVGVWCQDWCGCRCTGFGYQVMWNWRYDERQYPDLPEKIREWKAKGIRFLGYINPFIALEKDIYAIAKEKGYCVKDKNGEDYLVTITTFPAAMVDFTNPEAYAWYKDLIKENMIGIGMGGWMADFGEYLPVDAVLYNGDPKELHNQWPGIWARMNREAIEECGVSDEVFFFTRAGYTQSVEHAAMMWTGDQHVDWSVDDGIPSVIPATLSLAMSGYGITHSDAGGYTTIMHMRRTRELLMRWEEMNVFSPLFRTHEGNQPGNNVQFDGDEGLLEHTAMCTRMHDRLGDYIKDLVAEAADKGTPVIRPVFYHYDEPWAYRETTEYLLGRDILVAPVLEANMDKRTVTLPDDTWIHLYSGETYGKGTCTVEAPVGRPCVFVRKDAERSAELLTITK